MTLNSSSILSSSEVAPFEGETIFVDLEIASLEAVSIPSEERLAKLVNRTTNERFAVANVAIKDQATGDLFFAEISGDMVWYDESNKVTTFLDGVFSRFEASFKVKMVGEEWAPSRFNYRVLSMSPVKGSFSPKITRRSGRQDLLTMIRIEDYLA